MTHLPLQGNNSHTGKITAAYPYIMQCKIENSKLTKDGKEKY
jgi:hypothetical protein